MSTDLAQKPVKDPRTPVGVVLSSQSTPKNFTPPPLTRSRSGKLPELPKPEVKKTQTKPTPDQTESLKSKYLSAKQAIEFWATTPPERPAGLKTILTKAQQEHDQATNAQGVEQAINTLKTTKDYQSPVSSFLKLYRTCANQVTSFYELPLSRHPALVASIGQFDQLVNGCKTDYEIASTAKDIEKAKKKLDSEGSKLTETVKESSKTLQKLAGEFDKLQMKLDGWSQYAWIDIKAPNESLGQVRLAFNTAATIKDAETKAKELKTVSEKMKLIESNAKAMFAELESYQQERKKFRDAIHQVSLLREDPDGKIREAIRLAEAALVRADKNSETAKNLEQLKQSRTILTTHPKFLDPCKKLSATAKQNAEKELAAIPDYNQLYGQLRTVRSQLVTLPGTAKELNLVDELLAKHRISSNGTPMLGFVAAVSDMKGKPDTLLKQAQESSKAFLSKQLPESIRKAVEELNNQLSLLTPHVPDFRIDGQKIAISNAANLAKPEEALKALSQIGIQIKNDIAEAKISKSNCQKSISELNLKLNDLKNSQAPPLLLEPFETQLTNYVGKLLNEKDFKAAEIALADLVKKINETSTSFKENYAKWLNAKRDLKAKQIECKQIMGWPRLAGTAGKLLLQMAELVSIIDKNLDYAQGVTEAAKFQPLMNDLYKWLKEQNISNVSLLKDFDQFRRNARNQLENARSAVQLKLTEVGKLLVEKKITNVDQSKLHLELEAAWKKWLEALDRPVLVNGQSPKQHLEEQVTNSLKELGDIKTKCEHIINNKESKELTELVNECKTRDTEKNCQKILDEMTRLLGELKLQGVDVTALEGNVKNHLKNDNPPSNLQALMELYRPIKTRHAELLNNLQQSSGPAVQETQNFRKKAKELKKKFFEFPGYFENLDQNLSDVEAMLKSNDLSLIAEGNKQLEEYRKSFAEAVDKKKQFHSLENILSKWQEIVEKLKKHGETRKKDGVVKEYMADTFAQLNDDLKQLMMRMSTVGNENSLLEPALAMRELLKIEVKVNETIQKAEVQEVKYKEFKTKYELIEDKKIGEVKKHTSTGLLDSTDSYWKAVKTRLAKAKELAGTEGQMKAAMEALDKIDQELDDMLRLRPDQARDSLQTKNKEEGQKQRTLRDLIRQWEVDYKYFVENTLETTKKTMEKNPNADKSQLKNLEKAASFANKQLEPYLYIMSKLPHRSLKANSAPDMDEAIEAFTRARKELENFKRTAERLCNNPESTNFEYEKDLEQVRQDWVSRVQRFTTALKSLADEIKRTPSIASTDDKDKERYLGDRQTVDAFRDTADKVAELLKKLGNRFDPAAFDKPIQILCDKKAPNEKKLAAREDALRKVRALKTEMLDNPLTQTLRRETDNPFIDVRAEMGLVMAGIKKVEIAVLVAVE